jgi:hypothetical protein
VKINMVYIQARPTLPLHTFTDGRTRPLSPPVPLFLLLLLPPQQQRCQCMLLLPSSLLSSLRGVGPSVPIRCILSCSILNIEHCLVGS